jgi:phosphomannomutase
MTIHPLAGKPAPKDFLVDIDKLRKEYYARKPDIAARPSGTEEVYKLYAESFRGGEHLRRIQEEAQALISEALAGGIR